MIDGSTLPYEDNVALTRRTVEMAGDIPVEGELGTVGGKEDDHSAGIQYTDPAQAADFVARTGLSSFAPAIGTAHGVYAKEPKLDLDRLCDISRAVSVPLVLHGTSGVPHEVVRRCIAYGVCKVNYATELRIAFSDAVRQYLTQKPDAIDPKKYSGAGRDAVQKRVGELIVLLGSGGKA
jgi:tagatose 1,6-diphosphate aldolase GatY/KbaY